MAHVRTFFIYNALPSASTEAANIITNAESVAGAEAAEKLPSRYFSFFLLLPLKHSSSRRHSVAMEFVFRCTKVTPLSRQIGHIFLGYIY